MKWHYTLGFVVDNLMLFSDRIYLDMYWISNYLPEQHEKAN